MTKQLKNSLIFLAGMLYFLTMIVPLKADTHIKCGFAEPIQSDGVVKAFRSDSTTRPQRQHEYLTSDQRFLLHYDITGTHAIDTTSTIIPGTPDWLVAADRALHRSWHLLVDSLGFMSPPMDFVSYAADPPGGAYDIYFTNFGFYGMTYPEDLVNATERTQDYTGYTSIENDFKNFPTEGIPALEVTLAHEFFHLIHLGYGYKSESTGFHVQDLWWYELSSTWFENVAYPEVDDYLNYTPMYFDFPKPLDTTGGYEVGQYGEVLSSYHKPHLMETIWRDFIDNSAYASIDMGLQDETGHSFADSYQKFAGWNLITGMRAIPGMGFADAEKLPGIATEISPVTLDSIQFSNRLTGHNILYYKVQTNLPNEHLFTVGFTPGNSEVRGVMSPDGNPGNLMNFSKTEPGQDLLATNQGRVGLLAVANGSQSEADFSFTFRRKLFSIYPNPLVVGHNSVLNIFTTADNYEPAIRLYDVRGREVFSSQFSSQQSNESSDLITLSIDLKSSGLSKLPSGVYFLRLDGQGEKHVGKITILK